MFIRKQGRLLFFIKGFVPEQCAGSIWRLDTYRLLFKWWLKFK